MDKENKMSIAQEMINDWRGHPTKIETTIIKSEECRVTNAMITDKNVRVTSLKFKDGSELKITSVISINDDTDIFKELSEKEGESKENFVEL